MGLLKLYRLIAIQVVCALACGGGFGVFQLVQATSFEFVTCGSAIKLLNNNYKARLHSHDIKYGSGSGQQVCLCVFMNAFFSFRELLI